MNITEAIIAVSSIRNTIPIDKYPTLKDALIMAIQALQEKAEREKGCEWCNKGLRFESYLIDGEGNTASIEDNMVQTIIANYCPMCGRKLK